MVEVTAQCSACVCVSEAIGDKLNYMPLWECVTVLVTTTLELIPFYNGYDGVVVAVHSDVNWNYSCR